MFRLLYPLMEHTHENTQQHVMNELQNIENNPQLLVDVAVSAILRDIEDETGEKLQTMEEKLNLPLVRDRHWKTLKTYPLARRKKSLLKKREKYRVLLAEMKEMEERRYILEAEIVCFFLI